MWVGVVRGPQKGEKEPLDARGETGRVLHSSLTVLICTPISRELTDVFLWAICRPQPPPVFNMQGVSTLTVAMLFSMAAVGLSATKIGLVMETDASSFYVFSGATLFMQSKNALGAHEYYQ